MREAGVHESVTDGEARDWPSPRGKKDGESGGAVVGAAVAGRSGADAVEDDPLLPRRRPEGSERRDRRDEEHHRGPGDDVSGGFRRLRRRPERRGDDWRRRGTTPLAPRFPRGRREEKKEGRAGCGVQNRLAGSSLPPASFSRKEVIFRDEPEQFLCFA